MCRPTRAEVDALAGRLSELRTRRPPSGSRGEVTAELAALAMPDATLVVEVDAERRARPARAATRSRSCCSRTPGAEPRPLGKGASGGELSRVMLAIEVVIAGTRPRAHLRLRRGRRRRRRRRRHRDRAPARAARRARQVIVVTHLAQVAAFATNHLSVVKDSDGQVTASSVRQLDGDERDAEMARLLSGLPDSESGLAHARELLEIAAVRLTAAARPARHPSANRQW